MTLQSVFALAFTVFLSVGFVAIIILLGWFLIWKAFLSKFRLVRELLGQGDVDDHRPTEETQSHAKPRKVRKD